MYYRNVIDLYCTIIISTERLFKYQTDSDTVFASHYIIGKTWQCQRSRRRLADVQEGTEKE